MSFGWSGSDIATLAQLAWKIVQNTRKACGEHDELTMEVFGLHVVLRRLEKEVGKTESPLNRSGDTCREEVEAIVSGCQRVLGVLDKVLEKYNALSEKERSTRKLWQKVKFGNGELADLKDLREKATYYTSALSLYLNLVSVGSMGRVEKRMEEAGGDLKEVKRAVNSLAAHLMAGSVQEGSILTSYTNDDKAVWKGFRRGLVKSGFSSSFLRKHKDTIQAYFEELGSRGVLDDSEQCKFLQEEELNVADAPSRPSTSHLSVSDSNDTSGDLASAIKQDEEVCWIPVRREHSDLDELSDTHASPADEEMVDIETKQPSRNAGPCLSTSKPQTRSRTVPQPTVETDSESDGQETQEAYQSLSSKPRSEQDLDDEFHNPHDSSLEERLSSFDVYDDEPRIQLDTVLAPTGAKPPFERDTKEHARWQIFVKCCLRDEDIKTDPIQLRSALLWSERHFLDTHQGAHIPFPTLYISSPWGTCVLHDLISVNTLLAQFEYRTTCLSYLVGELTGSQLALLSCLTDNIDKIDRLIDARSEDWIQSLLSDTKHHWDEWEHLIQDSNAHMSGGGSTRGPGAARLKDKISQLTDVLIALGARVDDRLCYIGTLVESGSRYQDLMYDGSECDWSSSTPAAIQDWVMEAAEPISYAADSNTLSDRDNFSEPACFRENLMTDSENDSSYWTAKRIYQWIR